MAGPLRIFNDIAGRRLVASNTKSTEVSFPTLVQGEQPTIQLYFLDPTSGNFASPFTYVGLSGATLKLGIINGNPTGGPDTLIAYQDTWTAISSGFQGTLDCATIGISNAIGGSSSASCTVEIEVTESGGTPVKYFQGGVTIKGAVIDSLSMVPTPAASYLTAKEIEASYLKKVESAGQIWRSVSPNGLYGTDWGTNDDGTARIDSITF